MRVSYAFLRKLQAGATVFAAITVPVIVAVIGYLGQANLAEQGVKKDYVQLAVSILRSPEIGKDDDLRRWAVDVLSKHSPVAIPPKLRAEIVGGRWFIPWVTLGPPEDLLVPPMPYSELSKDRPTKSSERRSTEEENRKRFTSNAQKLESLQKWVRDRKETEQKATRIFDALGAKLPADAVELKKK